MTLVFPSGEWFERYGAAIDADDEYAEMAADWGVGFDGGFVFVMTDIPIDALGHDLPEDLRAELDEYVEDGTGYGFLGLEGGECTDARLVTADDPAVESAGFRMTGDYDAWTKLITGQIGAIDGMMSGQFDLDGDMQKVMQYSDAAARLTDISAELGAEPVTELYG